MLLSNYSIYFNIIIYIDIQISNRTLMVSQCGKCSQLSAYSQMLICGHFICKNCLPVWNHSHEIIVACPSCSIMTLISNDQEVIDVDPQNFVVCLECKSDVMSTRVFLDSKHRKHDVISVAKVVPQIQKSLRKYQLSLDLQNQALYSQVESLSKQKRILSQQYSRKLIQMRYSFDQLKNAIAQCEQSCVMTYQKIIIQVVDKYDADIKQIKNQILKCQSYIECIDHSLIKSNSCKHVASTQFYFQNCQYFDDLLNQLIDQRRKNIRPVAKAVNIQSPNLQPIKELVNKVKLLNVWQKPENKEKDVKVIKQNPENQIQKYFDAKRREILSNEEIPETKEVERVSIVNRASKISENPVFEKNDSTASQSYNIEGRIQNLRKTLKLGQRTSIQTRSHLSYIYK